MRETDIVVGKVYEDQDGLSRYVVSITPAVGRKKARVIWRRPGSFTTFLFNETMTKFLNEVRKPVERIAE